MVFIFWRLFRIYRNYLCYRHSWSYVTYVDRILCYRRYEREELFSQTQLKLCCNYRNVYVLIYRSCTCMSLSLGGGGGGGGIILTRCSVFPRSLGQSYVHTCAITFLFRSCDHWVSKIVFFFKKKKILVLISIISFYLFEWESVAKLVTIFAPWFQ